MYIFSLLLLAPPLISCQSQTLNGHSECMSISCYCGALRLLTALFIMFDCTRVSPETQAGGEPSAGPSSREEQGEQKAQGQFRHHQGAERQHEETG